MMFKKGDRIVSVSDTGLDIAIGEEYEVERMGTDGLKVVLIDHDGYTRVRWARDYQLSEVYEVIQLLKEYEV
jgi:hypothetical protein